MRKSPFHAVNTWKLLPNWQRDEGGGDLSLINYLNIEF